LIIKDFRPKISHYYYYIFKTVGARRLPAPGKQEEIAVSKAGIGERPRVQTTTLLTLEEKFLLDFVASSCGLGAGMVLAQAVAPYLDEARRRLVAADSFEGLFREWVSEREARRGAGRP